MKKIYTLNGKKLTLKASLYTQLAYKAQFGRDMLGDLVRAEKHIESGDYDKQLDGKIIFLQALYVLADEGSSEILPPFEDWLAEIDGADIGEIITTVTELYLSTTKADRKNG